MQGPEETDKAAASDIHDFEPFESTFVEKGDNAYHKDPFKSTIVKRANPSDGEKRIAS